jgi:hypothetical protein
MTSIPSLVKIHQLVQDYYRDTHTNMMAPQRVFPYKIIKNAQKNGKQRSRMGLLQVQPFYMRTDVTKMRISSKLWYLSTKLYDVTSQKTVSLSFHKHVHSAS